MYATHLMHPANIHQFHRTPTTHTKRCTTSMTREQSLHWQTGGIPPRLLSVFLGRLHVSNANIRPLQATATFLSSANVGANDSVPDAGLINGAGRFVGGPSVPWSRINVVKGKRYRLRLVNTSGIARYRFAIQGHSITVRLHHHLHIHGPRD